MYYSPKVRGYTAYTSEDKPKTKMYNRDVDDASLRVISLYLDVSSQHFPGSEIVIRFVCRLQQRLPQQQQQQQRRPVNKDGGASALFDAATATDYWRAGRHRMRSAAKPSGASVYQTARHAERFTTRSTGRRLRLVESDSVRSLSRTSIIGQLTPSHSLSTSLSTCEVCMHVLYPVADLTGWRTEQSPYGRPGLPQTKPRDALR